MGLALSLEELQPLFQPIGFLFLIFTSVTSPEQKIEALMSVHDEITTFLEHRKQQVDTDTILGYLVMALVYTRPFGLKSALRVIHELHYVKCLVGRKAFVVVNLEGALSFIESIDLKPFNIPLVLLTELPASPLPKSVSKSSFSLIDDLHKMALGVSSQLLGFIKPMDTKQVPPLPKEIPSTVDDFREQLRRQHKPSKS